MPLLLFADMEKYLFYMFVIRFINCGTRDALTLVYYCVSANNIINPSSYTLCICFEQCPCPFYWKRYRYYWSLLAEENVCSTIPPFHFLNIKSNKPCRMIRCIFCNHSDQSNKTIISITLSLMGSSLCPTLFCN